MEEPSKKFSEKKQATVDAPSLKVQKETVDATTLDIVKPKPVKAAEPENTSED